MLSEALCNFGSAGDVNCWFYSEGGWLIPEGFKIAVVVLCWLMATMTYGAYTAMTIRRQVFPRPITWALYALTTGLVAGTQISAGAMFLGMACLSMSAGCLAVSVASVMMSGVSGITRMDVGLGIVSVVAIALWALVGHPLAALILLVTADALATVPTFLAVVRLPGQEKVWPWMMHGVRTTISGLAVASLALIEVLAAVVLSLCNFAVAALILWANDRVLSAGNEDSLQELPVV